MTIYCYHSVDPDWPSPLAVSPAEFEVQCAWIAERTTVLPLTTAVERLDSSGRLPAGSAAITFDDGYAGCLTHALPVLQRHRLTATVFLVAQTLTPEGRAIDWAGTPPPGGTLSVEDVRAMQAAGIDFGSHSFAHHDLTTLTEQECVDDLRRSREILEDVLRRHVPFLAYPGGAHNAMVRRAAERAGYTHAFTLPDAPETPGDFAIPRVGIYPGNGPAALWLKSTRWYPRVRTSTAFPAIRALGRSVSRLAPRRG